MTSFHFRLLGWVVLGCAGLAGVMVLELRGLTWWLVILWGGGALGAWLLFVVGDDRALRERMELRR